MQARIGQMTDPSVSRVRQTPIPRPTMPQSLTVYAILVGRERTASALRVWPENTKSTQGLKLALTALSEW